MDTHVAMLVKLALIAIGISCTAAVENNVTSVKISKCSVSEINIDFVTELPFSGLVYVENFKNNDNCTFNGTGQSNEIDFEFKDKQYECDGAITKEFEGTTAFYTATVYLQFIPGQHDKNDRKYVIKCEVRDDFNDANTDITVVVPETEIEGNFQRPNKCFYTIDIVKITDEGEIGVEPQDVPTHEDYKLIHKWICPEDIHIVGAYCLHIQECYASAEGNATLAEDANKLDLIFDDCTQNKLINNPSFVDEYGIPANMRAMARGHPFQFDHSDSVYFYCELRFEACNSAGTCDRKIPEEDCVPPPHFRRKRAAVNDKTDHGLTIHVATKIHRSQLN